MAPLPPLTPSAGAARGTRRAPASLELLCVLAGAWLSDSVFLPQLEACWPEVPFYGFSLIGSAFLLLLVTAAVHVTGQPWRSLGLRAVAPKPVLRAGCGVMALCYVTGAVALSLLWFSDADVERLVDQQRTSTADLDRIDPRLILPLSLLVGFSEEVFYRGFVLSRVRSIAATFFVGERGCAALALAASGVLFAAGHAYQGWLGVGLAFAVGTILGRVTLRQGNLWPAIFAHSAMDAMGLVAARLESLLPAVR